MDYDFNNFVDLKKSKLVVYIEDKLHEGRLESLFLITLHSVHSGQLANQLAIALYFTVEQSRYYIRYR